MPFQLAFAVTDPAGDFGHGEGLLDVLLHHEKRAQHHWIAGLEVHRDARLRLVRLKRLVDDHDVQALAGLCPADVLVDQIGRQVSRADAAGAGQAVAIHHENLVRDRVQPLELLKEIGMVEPADAAAVPFQKTGLVQKKGPGAHTRQRDACRSRLVQEAVIAGEARLRLPSVRQ